MHKEIKNKEFYEKRLEAIIPQMAEILEKGCRVESASSRYGIKLYCNDRQYVMIRDMRNFERGTDLLKGGIKSGS